MNERTFDLDNLSQVTTGQLNEIFVAVSGEMAHRNAAAFPGQVMNVLATNDEYLEAVAEGGKLLEVVFTTDSWDNGYFYGNRGILLFEGVEPFEVDFEDELQEELAGVSGDHAISGDGALTERDELHVDVIKGTISRL